jgi:ribosomal protein L7/L12
MSSFEEQEIALLRQRIVRLEAQVEYLYKHFALTFADNTSESNDPQIIAALRTNNMIEAIRLYREKTGLGLAAAKSAVEEIKKRQGIY